jgi:hypothetical protein
LISLLYLFPFTTAVPGPKQLLHKTQLRGEQVEERLEGQWIAAVQSAISACRRASRERWPGRRSAMRQKGVGFKSLFGLVGSSRCDAGSLNSSKSSHELHSFSSSMCTTRLLTSSISTLRPEARK